MRLILTDLSVDRGERRIFSGLSLAIAAGQVAVITGPNGSGKSTLLKAIAGFLRPSSGTIGLEGAGDDAPLAESCHYLAHDNALKPILSVTENLAFWRHHLGAGATVAEALESMGLSGLEEIPAGYLSAGQKRRLAIARLIAARRPLWLVDEPTAALDSASQKRFAAVAEQHLAEGGLIVAATHQPLGFADPQRIDMRRYRAGEAA